MTNLLKYAANGTFYLRDHPTFLIPLYTFVVVQDIYAQLTKGMSNEILERIGRSFGAGLFTYLRTTKGPATHHFAKLLEQLSFLGLGEFTVQRQKPIVIANRTSPLARQYRKSLGVQKKPVSHFVLGILCGAYERMTAKQVQGRETRCLAQQHGACVYELKKTGRATGVQDLDMNTLRVEPIEYNDLIRRIIRARQYYLQRGHFKIWDLTCLNIPFALFDYFVTDVMREYPAAIDVIDYLGTIQTERAVAYQENRFGVKEVHKNMNNLFGQQGMILGLFGAIPASGSDTVEVDVDRCISFEQHVQLTGSPLGFSFPYSQSLIENLVTVLLKRTVTSFELDIRDQVLKRIVMKTGGSGDKKQNRLSTSVKTTIEENTKPKYFLT